MYCDNCKVKVVCKTNECPLCHKRLDTTEQDRHQIKQLTRAFPKRPRHRPLAVTPFNTIFLVLSLNVALVAIITNAILTPNLYWSVLVIGLLFYVYFLIRYTILDYSQFHRKVLGQTIALMAIFILIQQVFKKYFWIYEYVLPATILVSIIIIGIYSLVNIKTTRKYMFSLFLLAIIGMTPLLIIVFLGEGVTWPSIVVALASGSIMLSLVIQARKTLWAQVKRIFHQ